MLLRYSDVVSEASVFHSALTSRLVYTNVCFYHFLGSYQDHWEPRSTHPVDWWRDHRSVEQRESAEWPHEYRERHHPDKLREVAADDRSAAAGREVDQDKRRGGTQSRQTGTERVLTRHCFVPSVLLFRSVLLCFVVICCVLLCSVRLKYLR